MVILSRWLLYTCDMCMYLYVWMDEGMGGSMYLCYGTVRYVTLRYVRTYVCMYVCMSVYIAREGGREKERER